MGRVDVADDSIRRFVVRHYRFDPERHEHRHVVVDAFDNTAEFHALMKSIEADIQRRRLDAGPVGRNEHASGVVYEPGDRRRAAVGHLVRRMMEHGVDPRPLVEASELPSNIALLGPTEPARRRRRGLADRVRDVIDRWLPRAGRP